MKIKLLDCTLRDGAYIVNGTFGENNIRGILSKLKNANVDIIECGWLKMDAHISDSTYYHIPSDLREYLDDKGVSEFVAMIDFDRYDCDILPERKDGDIDAIRVVFPKGKVKEGVSVGKEIRNKGYGVYLQAANTPGYSDTELIELAQCVNDFRPDGLSIVDTFGAMYTHNIEHIISVLDNNLIEEINIGIHSHNNKQLSFALVMEFARFCQTNTERNIIIDSSLCGMGRGAGNACTELVVSYLNEHFHCNYDVSEIMDCIDLYMQEYQLNYKWGYSTQYALAGIYGCHVNNVAYLLDAHRIRNKDMKNVFDALSQEKRIQYDYDNLENVYLNCFKNEIDDSDTRKKLAEDLGDNEVVLILPGLKSQIMMNKVKDYINNKDAKVIGVNSVMQGYRYDWLFYANYNKYEYNKNSCYKQFDANKKIVTSNLVQDGVSEDFVVNYNSLQKGTWKYRENSVIMLLRLLANIGVKKISISGFDGYSNSQITYADGTLQPSFSDNSEREIIQNDIYEMLRDFLKTYGDKVEIGFLTESPFEKALSVF